MPVGRAQVGPRVRLAIDGRQERQHSGTRLGRRRNDPITLMIGGQSQRFLGGENARGASSGQFARTRADDDIRRHACVAPPGRKRQLQSQQGGAVLLPAVTRGSLVEYRR